LDFQKNSWVKHFVCLIGGLLLYFFSSNPLTVLEGCKGGFIFNGPVKYANQVCDQVKQ